MRCACRGNGRPGIPAASTIVSFRRRLPASRANVDSPRTRLTDSKLRRAAAACRESRRAARSGHDGPAGSGSPRGGGAGDRRLRQRLFPAVRIGRKRDGASARWLIQRERVVARRAEIAGWAIILREEDAFDEVREIRRNTAALLTVRPRRCERLYESVARRALLEVVLDVLSLFERRAEVTRLRTRIHRNVRAERRGNDAARHAAPAAVRALGEHHWRRPRRGTGVATHVAGVRVGTVVRIHARRAAFRFGANVDRSEER